MASNAGEMWGKKKSHYLLTVMQTNTAILKITEESSESYKYIHNETQVSHFLTCVQRTQISTSQVSALYCQLLFYYQKLGNTNYPHTLQLVNG